MTEGLEKVLFFSSESSARRHPCDGKGGIRSNSPVCRTTELNEVAILERRPTISTMRDRGDPHSHCGWHHFLVHDQQRVAQRWGR